jgi:hypothetical protein
MKVRLTQQISGSRNGQPWPAAGTEIDLPDDEARSLLMGGSAVDTSDDRGTVMVPPDGVHTPYLPENAGQPLVEAPADAASDPEAARAAANKAATGDFDAVLAPGVGAQHSDGSAYTPDEVKDSIQAEKDNREAFEKGAVPKVGEKKTAEKK